MVYANIAGYVVVALGGFVLGTMFGRKLAADAIAVAHSIEGRLAALEHKTGDAARAASTNHSEKHAIAVEHHAAAIEKLAGAIEKHAVAVDDHGAATVAAAVESHAAQAGSPVVVPASQNN